MKLNKTFGRIATTLVATAMLASVAVVPASAEGGVFEGGDSAAEALTSINIYKELMIPAGVKTPDVTFNFSITPAENVSGTITSDSKVINLKGGEGQNLTAGSVHFSSAEDGDGVTSRYGATINVVTNNDGTNEEVPVTLSLAGLGTFTDAGVYKYTITESLADGTAADVVADMAENQTLDLYVFVQREGETYYIANAVVYPAGATASGTNSDKTDRLTNWYQITPPTPEEPDPEVQSSTLNITKMVTGAMGDHNEEFPFEITGLTASKAYNVSIDGMTATAYTTDATGKLTVNLKHDQTATIYGITQDDLDVAEPQATFTQKGYSLDKTVVGETTDEEPLDYTVDVALTNGESTNVEFTNNREAVSPTGLVMDIAPYALLVVVAAAGCFVFLRKRRED